MMVFLRPIPLIALCASALAEPLLTVLEKNGFNEFAQGLQAHNLQNSPALFDGRAFVIYAPPDASLASSNGTARRADPQRKELSALELSMTSNIPTPQTPPQNLTFNKRSKSARDVPSGGYAQVTLIDDSEFVNLGPGRNQVIVQRSAAPGSRPAVVSGRGAAVHVMADDILFDQGVIRPINGTLTLPETVSDTLASLGVGKFRSLLQQSGLLADLDARAAVTVLAPVDSAFGSNSSWTGAELTAFVKRHVLVDYPAYTPVLEDGLVFPTLAGGGVRVSVRGGVISFDGAQILVDNAITKNGLVHTIDKVLTTTLVPPQTAAAATDSLSWKLTVCGLAGVTAAQFLNLI